jgi:hypothetical protein
LRIANSTAAEVEYLYGSKIIVIRIVVPMMKFFEEWTFYRQPPRILQLKNN